jgi:hypothetical protein
MAGWSLLSSELLDWSVPGLAIIPEPADELVPEPVPAFELRGLRVGLTVPADPCIESSTFGILTEGAV